MSRKPKLPAITPKIGDAFSRSVAELVSVWKGERGSKLDRVVLLRDLTESGLVNAFNTGNIDPVAPTDGMFAANPDPTTPPAPTGFTVSSAVLKVILSWDATAASNHAHTEIWRNDTDDLGTAFRVGQTSAAVYTDSIDSGEIAYYWIRHVNTSAVEGPYNATAGTSTQAAKVLVGATPIQWASTTNLTIDNTTGGSAKSVATTAWDTGGQSTNQVDDGEAFMQWSAADVTGVYCAGLTSQTGITAIGDIDFGLVGSGGSVYTVYKAGVLTHTSALVSTDSDTCSVSIEGTDVVFRVNGNVLYTDSAPTITYPIRCAVSYYSSAYPEIDSASWDRGNPGVHGLVLAANISNGAVTGLALANLAVDTAALADAAITTAKIGDAQINTAKISDYIQSDNYSNSGTYAGWKIYTRGGTGAIEANEITIRDSTGQVLLGSGGTLSSVFVHAANKITGSTIGTYVASAAIKTAYIDDLAVTTGKIKDLAVQTLKIKNKAVTVPGSDGFTSYVNLSSSSWTTVCSITVDAGDSGAVVDSLFATFGSECEDNGSGGTIYARVQYDSVTKLAGQYDFGSSGKLWMPQMYVKDAPASGNHTLRVQLKASSSGFRCNEASMFVSGSKK
jgi:hypothetical protein